MEVLKKIFHFYTTSLLLAFLAGFVFGAHQTLFSEPNSFTRFLGALPNALRGMDTEDRYMLGEYTYDENATDESS